MGIPARYVSGYLHPRHDAPIGETVAGESHAWAEAWIGEWFAFDPTNTSMVGERHVLVARGREYGDVTPLEGRLLGRALVHAHGHRGADPAHPARDWPGDQPNTVE